MSKITGRAFVQSASVAAVAGATTTAAQTDELAGLIEAHRIAYAAFERAVEHLEKTEVAYKAAHPEPIIVPSLLGGGAGIINGYEETKEIIARGYEAQRERLTPLQRVAPDLAEEVRAIMDAKEAENMALVDRVFADEDARKAAFGLAAAERDWNATSDAEEEAALAVCAYRCSSVREAALKAEYLATGPGFRDGLQDWQVEALLQSFKMESAS